MPACSQIIAIFVPGGEQIERGEGKIENESHRPQSGLAVDSGLTVPSGIYINTGNPRWARMNGTTSAGERDMPVRRNSGVKRVYQLKVTLRGIRPPIWRRILVTGDTNLQRLHWIIQTVMGWTSGHLHEFDVFGDPYGDPSDNEADVLDERRATLSKLIGSEKEKFYYLYDFGDSWEHEILVEKILPPAKGTRYPVCLKGRRACPPEDCGGAPGYADLLEILKDPSHPDHDDMVEWMAGDFDSEEFDIEEVNEGLGESQR